MNTGADTTGVVVRGRGWGPGRKPGAVSFTFDNLGEAAELEMGLWPADRAIGNHDSARKVVPALLERMRDFPVTFFVEGWNAGVYPETLRAIIDAGHEIGLHGWRHEVWSQQDEATQRLAWGRSLAAMRGLGIIPKGFRPPGGIGTPLLHDLMRTEGMSYVSEVGFGAALEGSVVRLPFAWRGVDGVFLEPDLGKAVGVSGPQDSGLEAMVRNFKAGMASAKDTGDHIVFIFHPFLLGKDPARIEALFELMDTARADGDLWLTSCGNVAQWLLSDSGVARIGAGHVGSLSGYLDRRG